MLDLSVIILTYNEERHIARCIDKITGTAKKIYVVDSLSTDGTQEIARNLGAEVIEHNWPGNQAAQFNWALDNIQIDTEWVLRIDADEYLSDELKIELESTIPNLPTNVTGIVMPLGRAFMGRVLKHGIVNGISMIRMFRTGCARYENRIMDEHLKLLLGHTYTVKSQFIDDNRMPLSYFVTKHNGYASKEAAVLLDAELGLTDNQGEGEFAESVSSKRAQKAKYARMPLFLRASAYFFYRYIFKLGFLDGKEGFLWDFLQGWWYRTLVDAKIYEIKKRCGSDMDKIRTLLKEEYGVSM